MQPDLVFIVEDEIDLLQVMQAALSHAHPELTVHTSITVDDAEESLAAMDDDLSRIALAVIDYRLGDRNGLEVIERLRASSSSLPILMLTGQAPAEAEERARALGAHVAWKPMNLQDFLGEIEKMLG